MNKSDLVVLGFLNRKSMYGYEIIQWLITHHMDKWADIKMPSVYNAMQRLQKKEHIIGKQVVEGNNPPRKVYSITEKGKTYLLELQNKYLTTCLDPKDFWLGISFMNKGFTKENFLRILEERKKKMKELEQFHKNHLEELKTSNKWQKNPFFIKVLMRKGERHHAEELISLEELKEEAEKSGNEIYFINEEK